MLGLPPAFNLSQDQTLQFKHDFSRTNVRCLTCIFIQVKPEQLIYGIVTQKRPHNLPNQVVKEQSDLIWPLKAPEYTLNLSLIHI